MNFSARHHLQKATHRLGLISESPERTARAFAIGAFCSVIPFIGPMVAVGAAIRLRLSKVAALIGTLTVNPWTFAFIYAGSFRIGEGLLHRHQTVNWDRIMHFKAGWCAEVSRVAAPLAIGNFILGLLLAGFSYLIVLRVLRRVSENRTARDPASI